MGKRQAKEGLEAEALLRRWLAGGLEWEAKTNQPHEFPRANDRRRGWALAHRLGCDGALG
jgi:hypothetical protein